MERPSGPETLGECGARTEIAYLDAVLVGGREQREVVVVDYDAGWPRRFEHERARIANALGDRALAIEHIGSTAVPGLAAKPIVDLLVIVEIPTTSRRLGRR